MQISASRLRHAAAAAWLIMLPACVCFSQATHYPVSPHRPRPRHPISGRWPTFYISGCEEITIPGFYILTADIDTGGAACINIHDTHSVTLDCNSHRITGGDGIVPVIVQNATAVSITNCSVSSQFMSPSGTVTPYGLDIENSADVALTSNTIAGIHFYAVSRAYLSNNQILGYHQQYNSHNVTVSQNSIKGVSDEFGAAGIVLDGGSSNQVLNNTMDGAWNGVPALALQDFNGWDDGIVLSNEVSDVISGNTIQNVWDAGIEASNSLMNTIISNNTISHTLGSAIGAWWDIYWVGNQVLNNQADDAWQLLIIYYAQSTDTPPSTVHFENNRFVGNVIGKLSGIDYAHVGPRSKIAINPFGYPKLFVGNNVLQNNQFGEYAPELIPADGFTDGGGNVCQTLTAGSPINCHP
jgi:parallel beta-helix repeat protein